MNFPEELEYLQKQEREIEDEYRVKYGRITRLESYEKDVSYRRVFRGGKAFLKSRRWLTEHLDSDQEPNNQAWFVKELT